MDSIVTYRVLAVILWCVGGHNWYAGRKKIALAQLGLFAIKLFLGWQELRFVIYAWALFDFLASRVGSKGRIVVNPNFIIGNLLRWTKLKSFFPSAGEVLAARMTDEDVSRLQWRLSAFAVGHTVAGLLLLAFFPAWGYASLAAAAFLLVRRFGDRDLISKGMPLDYYVAECRFFCNTMWLNVLMVVGPLFSAYHILSLRRLMKSAIEFVEGSNCFRYSDFRHVVERANPGMDLAETRRFSESYLRDVVDNGEWLVIETGNSYYFTKESVARCRELMNEFVDDKGLASLLDLETVLRREYKHLSGLSEVLASYIVQAECSFSTVLLAGSQYYCSNRFFSQVKAKIDNVLRRNVRVSLEELSRLISTDNLTADEAQDLINQVDGDFENLVFEDGRYLVGHVSMDHVGICQACGIAKVVDPGSAQDGEYFCCDYCRETEKMVSQIVASTKREKILKAGIDASAFGVALPDVARSWEYNKGRAASLSGKAHGYVAEDANTMLDRLTGHKASVIGTDNAKDGPDRIVDGQLIQTKYCRSAWASVNEAFGDDGSYRYYADGKPMQLEVPRDQYEQAVKEMEKRILDGKVPGVTNPEEASSLVRKGWLTYQQAQNICKFGTIESVCFDSFTGAIVGVSAGGISFVLSTAISYWQTGDIKKALRGSVVVAVQTGGKTFAAYVIGAQVQRIPAVKNFLDSAININFGGHGDAVKSLGEGLSKMAGKNQFNNAAANSAVRGAVVTAIATFAVTSVWEIGCYCAGRMSGMQCFKNVVVGGAGVAGGTAASLYGAALGTAVCPGIGTVVGGLIGGLVGGTSASFVAKKCVDLVGDDDADFIMPLVQSQIQVLAIMFCLSKSEVDKVMEKIDEYIRAHKAFVGDVFSHDGVRRQYVTRVFKPFFAEVALERPILLAKDVSGEAISNAFTESPA